MAKYTPNGWAMSAAGERRYRAMYQKVDGIVRKHVRKYTLAWMDRDDLMQEGRMAAAYAVDTYQAERGNLDGYISRVVYNALAMVATEALAQARQPYKQVQDPDGSWRKSPINHVELEPDMITSDVLDAHQEMRDVARQAGFKAMSLEQRIAQLRLSTDAKQLLQVRLHTPPELWILARNMNRGRMKLEAHSVCLHLGWVMVGNGPDKSRYQRACRELRDQFRLVLGIDDMTFEALKTAPIDDVAALQAGAKSRDVKGIRCS